MQPEYKSKYNTHFIRIIVILAVLAVVGIGVRAMMVPKDFGQYGHYRAGAIQDEINREVRNGTNASCLPCHPYIKEMHFSGVHKTVSCEFCHGPFGDHLRRQQWLLNQEASLQEAFKQVIEHMNCEDDLDRFRLLQAGLIKGSGEVYTCRCDLYRRYFKDRL